MLPIVKKIKKSKIKIKLNKILAVESDSQFKYNLNCNTCSLAAFTDYI